MTERPLPHSETDLIIESVERAIEAKSGPISGVTNVSLSFLPVVWGELIKAAKRGLFIPTHRHKKRGTAYQKLGEARANVSYGDSRVVTDGATLVVYQGQDGQLHVRFPDEFSDGRFEELETRS